MPKAESRETLVGSLALVVAVALFALTALANRVDQKNQNAAARYTAEFARADGMHVGAPVRIAGMEIGNVGDVRLDGGYRAILTLVLNQNVPLPDDTAAIIETDGVFGSKYIELQPGGSEDLLKPGSRISFTQDAVIIEDLIAKIVAQAKANTKPVATTENTP
jgi:phospholipid/cholesterol/gamma-HCH transport system substrate-binding protein